MISAPQKLKDQANKRHLLQIWQIAETEPNNPLIISAFIIMYIDMLINDQSQSRMLRCVYDRCDRELPKKNISNHLSIKLLANIAQRPRYKEIALQIERERERGLHKQLANFPFLLFAYSHNLPNDRLQIDVSPLSRDLCFGCFFFIFFLFIFVVCCQFCVVRSFVCRSLTGLAMICWFIVGNPQRRAGFSLPKK